MSKDQKGNTKSLKNFQITKGCRFRHPFDLNNIELFILQKNKNNKSLL